MHMTRNVLRPCLSALAAMLTVLGAGRSIADETVTVALQVPRETAQALRRTLPPSIGDPLDALGLTQVAEEELVVPVPMRDGVQLAATIIRPRAGAGKTFPTVLIRSPYRPEQEVNTATFRQDRAAAAGQGRLRHRDSQRPRHSMVAGLVSLDAGPEPRWLRHPELGGETAVVDRKSRHLRILVQRRAGPGLAGRLNHPAQQSRSSRSPVQPAWYDSRTARTA